MGYETAWLDEPYGPGETFDDRIGLAMPALVRLAALIREDLRQEVPFGIGWWGYLEHEARVCTGDYLIDCVDSIRTNMAEAWLEKWDARLHARIESDFSANAVVRTPSGGITIKSPPRCKPRDTLHARLWDKAIGGFFRAISSSMDCLGQVMCGVAALPITNLRKEDFGSAVELLTTGQKNKKKYVLHALQTSFGAKVKNLLDSGGPRNWWLWACGSRNTLVHRGRRSQLETLQQRRPVLLDACNQPILRAEVVRLLPREPDVSTVEAFKGWPQEHPVLTEDAFTTMQGIYDSFLAFAEIVLGDLGDLWVTRRSDPALLPQPKQWSAASRLHGFPGYKPESISVSPKQMTANPDAVTRLRAAGIGVDQQKRFAEIFLNEK